MRFEEQITINAPADKVFEYVADLPRHGEWGMHDLKVRQTSSGPIEKGATFESTSVMFGKQHDKVTITEYEAPNRLVYESTGKAGRAVHEMNMSESDGVTTLRKSAHFVEPKFVMKLFAFRVKKDAPKGLQSDLSRIKRNVEGGA